MKHIVDANVFIHGRRPDFEDMQTVTEVMEELKSQSGQRSFTVTDIEVIEPTERSVSEVKQLSERISSPTSEADEKLIALALDKGGKVVSDDKAVQNLALHLEVEFQGFMEDSINEKRAWTMVCPSCGKETDERCSNCGKTPIRRQV